jgi:hypothetical protein
MHLLIILKNCGYPILLSRFVVHDKLPRVCIVRSQTRPFYIKKSTRILGHLMRVPASCLFLCSFTFLINFYCCVSITIIANYKILTLYSFITLNFQDKLSHPYLQNFSLTISLSHMHRLCKIIFLSRQLLLISNLKHKFRRLATEVKKNKQCNISDSHSPLRFIFTTFHSTSYLLLNAL